MNVSLEGLSRCGISATSRSRMCVAWPAVEVACSRWLVVGEGSVHTSRHREEVGAAVGSLDSS